MEYDSLECAAELCNNNNKNSIIFRYKSMKHSHLFHINLFRALTQHHFEESEFAFIIMKS